MKALVTGAAGFAGRHLVEHLEGQGDEVVGVDRTQMDLTDFETTRRCLDRHRPEVVFHLGGASDVAASWREPVSTFAANATGTLHVVEAALGAGVQRMLVVSSADVYGPVQEDQLPLTELSPVRPHSPYAASKLAAEQVAVAAHLGRGLETIRVRAFNHIGPGQSARFAIPGMARSIARNEVSGESGIPVGNTAAARDLTDVRDVVRAYRLLVDRGAAGEVYHVCSGAARSISEVADELISMASSEMTLQTDPARYRPVDIPVLVGSPAKLVETTGWKPEIDISQTLADVLAEWRGDQATRAEPSSSGRIAR